MKGLYAQPKYPSMERQDLTQGQLGSFKFTPIDVAPSSTLGDTPFLLAAQAKLRARIENQPSFSPVTADNQINFSSLASQQWLDDQLHKSSTTLHPHSDSASRSAPDSSFFNNHIKPDLEDSRLKLGTAAFRAVVDGSSPDKSFSQTRSRAEVSHTAFLHSLSSTRTRSTNLSPSCSLT